MTALSADDILHWAARSVGPGASAQNVRRLAGSTSSTLYALEIIDGKASLPCVLRVYDNAVWLAYEPDAPRREAAALARVTAAGLSAPVLVASDPEGAETGGIPCLLMTRLPGEVVLDPRQSQSLAARTSRSPAAAPCTLPADDFPWVYQPYADLSALTPPAWSRVPQLWEQALALSRMPPPSAFSRASSTGTTTRTTSSGRMAASQE